MSYIEHCDKTKAAFAAIKTAIEAVGGHVEEYSFDRLQEYAAMLFDRFCPFKVGDRVRIVGDLDIQEGSGWYHCRHMLMDGSTAVVVEVDARKGKFDALVKPENQTWIPDFGDNKGVPQPIADEDGKCFYLSERWLQRVLP